MKPSCAHRSQKGFTLIELMLVTAIISLLAAIAIPKFGELIIKSKEAAAKGNLGSVRSAMSIYYADNEGIYPGWNGNPNNFLIELEGKYIDKIPIIRFTHHKTRSWSIPGYTGIMLTNSPIWVPALSILVIGIPFGENWPGMLGDYVYDLVLDAPVPANIKSPPTAARLRINCSHNDTRGVPWSSW